MKPGDIIGQYEIESVLGRGGMGTVYAVKHRVLGGRHALKVLHPEVSEAPEGRERFRREARVMHDLGKAHKHILEVEEYGEEGGGVLWLRVPLMRGMPGKDGKRYVTLQDRMDAEGGLPEAEAKALLEQILAGLGYAHEQGALHRDLKPANILLAEDGSVRITDFGLVKIVDGEWLQSQFEKSIALTAGFGKTRHEGEAEHGASTESLIGTWSYMAPEVRKGAEASEASDLWSVGLLAFQVLTGEVALGLDLPSDLVPGIGENWDDWVRRATAGNPANRFSSVMEARRNLPALNERFSNQSSPASVHGEPRVDAVETSSDSGGQKDGNSPEATTRGIPGKSKKRRILATLFVFAILVAAGAIYLPPILNDRSPVQSGTAGIAQEGSASTSEETGSKTGEPKTEEPKTGAPKEAVETPVEEAPVTITLKELVGQGELPPQGVGRIVIPCDDLFDNNEFTIREEARPVLMKLAFIVQTHPEATFIFEGLSDSLGDDEFNLNLSLKWAAALRDWLIEDLQIGSTNIRVAGLGDHRPVTTPDGSIAKQAATRRIEILIRPSEGDSGIGPPFPGSLKPVATLGSTELFSVDPTEGIPLGEKENVLAYADLLFDEGQSALAARQLQIFLRDNPLSPNAPFAWFKLGECYRKVDQLEDAGTTFAYLIETFDEATWGGAAAFRLGELHFEDSDFEKAIPLFQAASEQLSDPDVVKRARELLDRCKKGTEDPEIVDLIRAARERLRKISQQPAEAPSRDESPRSVKPSQ